jgi:hypothetical protein
MLGVIALEGRDLELADEYAAKAIERYAALGDAEQEAQAHFLRGEVAAARDKPGAARTHYQAALKKMPTHVPSMLQIAAGLAETKGEAAATDSLHASLPRFWPTKGPLDAKTALEGAANFETIVVLTEAPHLSQLLRDALLQDIDSEKDPMRRGIRYFFAATLEVRLREYDIARGHGVLARDEFAETEIPPPIDVQAFLDRLAEAAG